MLRGRKITRNVKGRKRSYLVYGKDANDTGVLYKRSKTQAARKFYGRGRFLSSMNVPQLILPSSIGNAVPQSIRTKLIYYDQGFTLNPSAGTPAVQVFAANGVWDVDLTGVGHQPAGFDQWMLLYKKYTVLQSSIKVSVTNSSANILNFGIAVTSQSATVLDDRRYVENGYAKYMQLEPSSYNSHVITHKCDIGQFNQEKELMDDDTFSGNSTANPTTGTFYHVWARAQDPTTDPTAIQFTAEIQFEVIFREPRLNDIS